MKNCLDICLLLDSLADIGIGDNKRKKTAGLYDCNNSRRDVFFGADGDLSAGWGG